jgi:hypothetical protein
VREQEGFFVEDKGELHEEFEWEGGETIEPKTETGEINETILTRKVI